MQEISLLSTIYSGNNHYKAHSTILPREHEYYVGLSLEFINFMDLPHLGWIEMWR